MGRATRPLYDLKSRSFERTILFVKLPAVAA